MNFLNINWKSHDGRSAADAIPITVLILFLLLESCAPSAGISKYKIKIFLSVYDREDGHYFVKFHKMCGHNDISRERDVFLGESEKSKYNIIIRCNSFSAKRQIDLDELLEDYLIRCVRLISPIEKRVKYQIYLCTEPQHSTALENTDARETFNLGQGILAATPDIKPQVLQLGSTPETPKIRSTVTVEYLLTTPAPPAHARTIHISDSTVKLPNSTVPTAAKIFAKIPVQVTNKTLIKETKTTQTSSLFKPLEFHKLTTQTVPQFSRIPISDIIVKIPLIQQKIEQALDKFERKYYATTLSKLSSITPVDRRENGISFVLSSSFLFLILSALSMEVDNATRAEIDSCLKLDVSYKDKMKMMKHILDELPQSSDELKFRWSTRLVVNGSWHPTTATKEVLRLHVDKLGGNETPEQLTMKLNHMVEQDSGGAMRNTFEEDELAAGARVVLINTMYLRARWRVAPTLLNGTYPFCDADGAPQRTTRMIRVNDIVRYADLVEWDAQAVEISYATPGLTLLLLVPRERSLRALAQQVTNTSLHQITARMRPLRAAVTLPIYTLRMTLLLPNKLQAMGISRLVDPTNTSESQELRLSHAVQRLMFWAEAGRNAFKDDGIEWDARPDMEIMVDRPYIFYVHWRKLTLLHGNFVF